MAHDSPKALFANLTTKKNDRFMQIRFNDKAQKNGPIPKKKEGNKTHTKKGGAFKYL